jgi:phage shock protein C
MYCTNCGTQLREADRFCSQCAKPTGVGAPESARATGRRLVRPMAEKKIAGVCAGFARYFDTDVTLMRLLWLVVALFTGIGFIAYLVAWIIMPKEEPPPALPVRTPSPVEHPV